MKPNLELDLLNNKEIVDKCVNSYAYAQNLYSALCNNKFFYNEKEYTCSWRFAGGIVADLRNKGETYIDFYCSGIICGKNKGYVPEGFVTDEIRDDLLKLGWSIKPYES